VNNLPKVVTKQRRGRASNRRDNRREREGSYRSVHIGPRLLPDNPVVA